MSKHIFVVISLASLAFACTDDTAGYRSAITGDSCDPDMATIQYEGDAPKKSSEYCKAKSNNGHGNNEDGVDSSNPGSGSGGPNGETDQSCDGTGDCIDDEIRNGPDGGDEECELPPGCDETLCCAPDDGDDGDGDDGDDGDGDDGDDGDGDPGAPDPAEPDPAPEPEQSCEATCDVSSDCASERSCVDGCCVVALE